MGAPRVKSEYGSFEEMIPDICFGGSEYHSTIDITKYNVDTKDFTRDIELAESIGGPYSMELFSNSAYVKQGIRLNNVYKKICMAVPLDRLRNEVKGCIESGLSAERLNDVLHAVSEYSVLNEADRIIIRTGIRTEAYGENGGRIKVTAMAPNGMKLSCIFSNHDMMEGQAECLTECVMTMVRLAWDIYDTRLLLEEGWFPRIFAALYWQASTDTGAVARKSVRDIHNKEHVVAFEIKGVTQDLKTSDKLPLIGDIYEGVDDVCNIIDVPQNKPELKRIAAESFEGHLCEDFLWYVLRNVDAYDNIVSSDMDDAHVRCKIYMQMQESYNNYGIKNAMEEVAWAVSEHGMHVINRTCDDNNSIETHLYCLSGKYNKKVPCMTIEYMPETEQVNIWCAGGGVAVETRLHNKDKTHHSIITKVMMESLQIACLGNRYFNNFNNRTIDGVSVEGKGIYRDAYESLKVLRDNTGCSAVESHYAADSGSLLLRIRMYSLKDYSCCGETNTESESAEADTEVIEAEGESADAGIESAEAEIKPDGTSDGQADSTNKELEACSNVTSSAEQSTGITVNKLWVSGNDIYADTSTGMYRSSLTEAQCRVEFPYDRIEIIDMEEKLYKGVMVTEAEIKAKQFIKDDNEKVAEALERFWNE